mgnify:FL=1|jgi:hypothetical protein
MINFNIYGQVKVLNRIVFDRVTFSDSDDLNEKTYYRTISLIINDYINKYHRKDRLKVIIYIYNTQYQLKVDNDTESLINQLLDGDRNLDYGIFIRLPDSCLSVYKMLNLIDLGFSQKDSILSCLKRYARTDKYFPHYDCYLSEEFVEKNLDIEMDAHKMRFLRKMKKKYSLSELDCLSKENYMLEN